MPGEGAPGGGILRRHIFHFSEHTWEALRYCHAHFNPCLVECARDKSETDALPFECQSDGRHIKKQCFGDLCFCVRRLEEKLDPLRIPSPTEGC